MAQATWAPRNSQRKTLRISLATVALGSCGCILSMFSGSSRLIPTAQAFANALQPQALRGNRVAMGVRFKNDHRKDFKDKYVWTKDFNDKTDAELHEEITQARKEAFEFRLDVFRKRQPSVGGRLYKAQRKVVVAKEILNQRRIEKYYAAFRKDLRKDVKAPMSSKWTEEQQINAFQSYWTAPAENHKWNRAERWWGHSDNKYEMEVPEPGYLEEMKGMGKIGHIKNLVNDVARFEKEKGIKANRRADSDLKRLSCAPARRAKEALKAIQEEEEKLAKEEGAKEATEGA